MISTDAEGPAGIAMTIASALIMLASISLQLTPLYWWIIRLSRNCHRKLNKISYQISTALEVFRRLIEVKRQILPEINLQGQLFGTLHSSLVDYLAQVIKAKNCPTNFYCIFQLVWVPMTTTQNIRVFSGASIKHFFHKGPPFEFI